MSGQYYDLVIYSCSASSGVGTQRPEISWYLNLQIRKAISFTASPEARMRAIFVAAGSSALPFGGRLLRTIGDKVTTTVLSRMDGEGPDGRSLAVRRRHITRQGGGDPPRARP